MILYHVSDARDIKIIGIFSMLQVVQGILSPMAWLTELFKVLSRSYKTVRKVVKIHIGTSSLPSAHWGIGRSPAQLLMGIFLSQHQNWLLLNQNWLLLNQKRRRRKKKDKNRKRKRRKSQKHFHDKKACNVLKPLTQTKSEFSITEQILHQDHT